MAAPRRTRSCLPRSIAACARCRTRKSKCDGNLPTCNQCAKAGVECFGYDNVAKRTFSRSYLYDLETQVDDLKSQVQQLHKRLRLHSPSSDPSEPSQPSKLPQPQQPEPDVPAKAPDPQVFSNPAPEGLSVGKLIFNSLSPPQNSPPPSSDSSSSYLLPSAQVIRQFFDVYRFTFHHSTPLFHESDLDAVLSRVCADPKLSSPEDTFMVLMVLAIASYFLSRLLKPTSELRRTSEAFHALAQQSAKPALFTHDISGLQRILLLAYYAFFNPTRGSAWYLTGMAARLCIDIGLHNEHQLKSSRNSKTTDLKRRLFWTTYALDRSMCVILGRPPNIPDKWISTPFPALEDDSHITEDAILPGPPAPHKLHTQHVFQFRRLQSEMQDKIHATTADRPSDEWLRDIQFRLDTLYQSRPNSTTTGMTTDMFFHLAYHLSIIQLNRPSPAMPTFAKDSMRKCLEASVVVVDLYRKAFRTGKLHHVWGSVHHLFIAGVTFLNALWRAHQAKLPCCPSLVDATITIQECSSVLQSLASFVPNATGCHESFESLSTTVLQRLRANMTDSSLSSSSSNTQTPAITTRVQPKMLSSTSPAASTTSSSNHSDVSPADLTKVSKTDGNINSGNSNSNSSLHRQGSSPDSARTLADIVSLPADLHALDDILTNPNNSNFSATSAIADSFKSYAYSHSTVPSLFSSAHLYTNGTSAEGGAGASSGAGPRAGGGGGGDGDAANGQADEPPTSDLDGLPDLAELFPDSDWKVGESGDIDNALGLWGGLVPI